MRVSVVVARGLRSCGARAQLLRDMWDLPGPGIKPVSPALAGGFLTTVPPGQSLDVYLFLQGRAKSLLSVVYLKNIYISQLGRVAWDQLVNSFQCPAMEFELYS